MIRLDGSAVFAIFVLMTTSFAVPSTAQCELPPAALRWFKYVTFYSWHIEEGNWTTLGQSQVVKELTEFHNLTGRAGLLEVSQVFFQPMKVVDPTLRGLAPRPDGLERWQALVPLIRTAVGQGSISGFFLGDELVWNNITWEVLNMTAALVKATFPTCFVYYNEGGAPLYAQRNVNGFHSPYPFVPLAVDFISSDDYDDMWLPKGPRWFYESFLYPKLGDVKQKAFVVPPVYAWLNVNANVTWWDEQQLRQIEGYLQWIAQDERLVGLNGFHLSSYLPDDLGLMMLPRTLACYEQLASQLEKFNDSRRHQKLPTPLF